LSGVVLGVREKTIEKSGSVEASNPLQLWWRGQRAVSASRRKGHARKHSGHWQAACFEIRVAARRNRAPCRWALTTSRSVTWQTGLNACARTSSHIAPCARVSHTRSPAWWPPSLLVEKEAMLEYGHW